MSNAIHAALVKPWLDLWNGNLSLADEIVADDFVTHAAMIGGSGEEAIPSRAALTQWIAGLRAALPDLAFTIAVGPIADAEHLVIRWRAKGTYAGGMPGTPPEAVGRKVDFTGTDVLRIAGGKIAEYWLNTDTLLFVQQLGLVQLPQAR